MNSTKPFQLWYICMLPGPCRRPFCFNHITGVDPGFPVGGGANSPREDRQQTIFAKFSEKVHEIEKIFGPGRGTHALGSATAWCDVKLLKVQCNVTSVIMSCILLTSLPIYIVDLVILPLLDRCYGDQCYVATGDQELCLYEGVSQTVCENEGCCYDAMTSPNCYYSNLEGMMSFLFSVSSI